MYDTKRRKESISNKVLDLTTNYIFQLNDHIFGDFNIVTETYSCHLPALAIYYPSSDTFQICLESLENIVVKNKKELTLAKNARKGFVWFYEWITPEQLARLIASHETTHRWQFREKIDNEHLLTFGAVAEAIPQNLKETKIWKNLKQYFLIFDGLKKKPFFKNKEKEEDALIKEAFIKSLEDPTIEETAKIIKTTRKEVKNKKFWNLFRDSSSNEFKEFLR